MMRRLRSSKNKRVKATTIETLQSNGSQCRSNNTLKFGLKRPKRISLIRTETMVESALIARHGYTRRGDAV
jgi:hypothetical protein